MFSKIHKKLLTVNGFTLLELIIVFSVIAMVSTVGIAAFVNYSRTQALQTSYLDLLNTLNVAKSYSISQIKPSSCGINLLQGYRVAIDTFNNKYSLYTECQGYEQLIKSSFLSKDKSIAFNSTLTTNSSILFPILSNDISNCANSCTITINGYGNQRAIVVSSTGLITGSEASAGSTGATPTPAPNATPTPTPAPNATPTPTPAPTATPPPAQTCTNGTYSCSGSTLQVCVSNSYVNVTTCPAGQTCNASLATCTIVSSTPGKAVKCGRVKCIGICIPVVNICLAQ
jgi:prepilin-type N-terminal cleavage/methylation domain-containing protein